MCKRNQRARDIFRSFFCGHAHFLPVVSTSIRYIAFDSQIRNLQISTCARWKDRKSGIETVRGREREYAAFVQTTKQTSHRTHVDIRRYAFYSFSQMSALFLANLSEYYVIIMKNLYGIFCNVIFLLLLKKQNIRIHIVRLYTIRYRLEMWRRRLHILSFILAFSTVSSLCVIVIVVAIHYGDCCVLLQIYMRLLKKCDSKCIAWKVGSNGSNMMIRTKPRTYNIHYEQMCIKDALAVFVLSFLSPILLLLLLMRFAIPILIFVCSCISLTIHTIIFNETRKQRTRTASKQNRIVRVE